MSTTEIAFLLGKMAASKLEDQVPVSPEVAALTSAGAIAGAGAGGVIGERLGPKVGKAVGGVVGYEQAQPRQQSRRDERFRVDELVRTMMRGSAQAAGTSSRVDPPLPETLNKAMLTRGGKAEAVGARGRYDRATRGFVTDFSPFAGHSREADHMNYLNTKALGEYHGNELKVRGLTRDYISSGSRSHDARVNKRLMQRGQADGARIGRSAGRTMGATAGAGIGSLAGLLGSVALSKPSSAPAKPDAR